MNTPYSTGYSTANLGVTIALDNEKWNRPTPIQPVVAGLSSDQVKDVVSRFVYDHAEHLEYADPLRNYGRTQTFAQTEVKEVVVGLSDEQLIDLIRGLSRTDRQFDLRLDFAREWLKAQTFTQPQFTPNWDDVPDAVMRNVVYEWYGANGALICSVFERNELRPQSMLQVKDAIARATGE